MIDKEIKESIYSIREALDPDLSYSSRIIADAFIQAEARARLWEDDFWKQRQGKTLDDYVNEVEEELRK